MKILYICTHNRCRSILSEAITRHFAKGRIEAFSAGSQPAGEVHPLTLKYLQARGISIEGLRSQSWDDFAAEEPELVVTVCDSAANEVCPLWMGDTLKIHWGLPDPSKLQGTEEEIRTAFFSVMDTIQNRVKKLLALPLENMEHNELQRAVLNLVKEE